MTYTKTDLAWEEVNTEHIVQDKWIDFRRSAYRLPDGNIFEPFYSFSRRDYVVVVASDCDGNYLCVRQFRQGIREVTTEFPAGGLERSDGREYRVSTAGAVGESLTAERVHSGEVHPEGAVTEKEHPKGEAAEDALATAKRELLEETGYSSTEWTHLLTIPSYATMADNFAYIYRAENCRRTEEQHLDETEFLHVELHTGQEIEELIRTGGFQQAVHVMAWLLAKERGRGRAEGAAE